MSDEKNNLKDSHSQVGLNIKDTSEPTISYTKSSKLVTALFMVTDIMDKEEPLRNKLRTLGVGVISDVYSDPAKVVPKINEILSFLDIALSINLVSEMNGSILKKEFFKLIESVKEYRQVRSSWLEDFLHNSSKEEVGENGGYIENSFVSSSDAYRTKQSSTRIGVQKGGTLMNALRGVNTKMSDKSQVATQGFDVLKRQRRTDITSVLKMSGGVLTITDIKNKSKGHTDKFPSLASCGEKTLQRELVSMVKDGVLKKEGEKRWSRYSIL